MKKRWSLVLGLFQTLGLLKGRRDNGLRTFFAGVLMLLYCLAIYLACVHLLQDTNNGCLDDIINNTFRVYKAHVIKSSHSFAKLMPGMFCFLRIIGRDLGSILSRGFSLYASLAKDMCPPPHRLSRLLKIILILVYTLQPVLDIYLTLYCMRKSESNHIADFFRFIIPPTLQTLLFIPSTAIVTIFIILLDTANESLGVLCDKIDSITDSMGPKPFLELKSLNVSPFFLKSAVTKELIFSLRRFHYQIIEFLEVVMKTFEADILVFLIFSFYINVLYNYTIVFNTAKFFQSWEVAVVVISSFMFSVLLTMNVWIVCAGPSIIKDQREVLLSSVARLSTVSHLSSDVMYEIRMLQLQIRHLCANFNVYGMFKINISLLFTMCASIASYIVILIQFATDPQETTDTPYLNNYTTERGVNFTTTT